MTMDNKTLVELARLQNNNNKFLRDMREKVLKDAGYYEAKRRLDRELINLCESHGHSPHRIYQKSMARGFWVCGLCGSKIDSKLAHSVVDK